MRFHTSILVAGFLLTLLAEAAYVYIIWKGNWQVATEAQRIGYLGEGLLANIGLVAFITLFIAGPLRNLTAKAGPVEIDFTEADTQPTEHV